MSVNLIAVAVSTGGAFILSSIWYMVFGKTRAGLLKLDIQQERRPKPPIILLELLRTLVLALIFSGILSQFSTVNLKSSLVLGLLLWTAFPVILLSGSIMWDKVPAKLAAIHAGDWFIKLMLIAILIGAWR